MQKIYLDEQSSLFESSIEKQSLSSILRTKDHNDYNIYVKYRSQTTRACRKAVSDYEHSLSKEVKSNPKAFFAYVKSKRKYASSIPDLKDGSKIITKAKLPYLTLILKVFTKEKNTLPDFEPVCEANISEVVFSEDKVKKKLLNLNPLSHLGQAIYIREY